MSSEGTDGSSSALTFHVPVVPRTVPFLLPAIESLRQSSSFRFRLVGNGLDANEIAIVRDYAADRDRLSVFILPTRRMLPHGVVLTALFCRFGGERWFAFCDSDIFAGAAFQDQLQDALARHEIVTGCSAVLWEPGDQRTGFIGRHTHAPDGTTLGTSYFAVYRTEVVRRILDGYSVGFEGYLRDQLPGPVQDALMRVGWKDEPIDTAKVLNLLAQQRGARLAHLDFPGLVHLGGVSSWLARREVRVNRQAPAGRFRLNDRLLAEFDPLDAPADGDRMTPDERRVRATRRARSRFFGELLASRFGLRPAPVNELRDPQRRAELDRVIGTVVAACGNFPGCRGQA